MSLYFDRDDIALPGFSKYFKKASAEEEAQHMFEAEKLRFVPDASRPPATDKAGMARYLAHKVDMCIIGTISTMAGRQGLPFTNVLSVCDGPKDNSTGVPYFYVTNLDQSSHDIAKNNSVSISMSEWQTGYCQKNRIDAESPLCTRLTMAGKFVKVTDKVEQAFALKALISRHPSMKAWSLAHQFYVAKLDIELIWLIDFFGGASIIDPKDYYAVKV